MFPNLKALHQLYLIYVDWKDNGNKSHRGTKENQNLQLIYISTQNVLYLSFSPLKSTVY